MHLDMAAIHDVPSASRGSVRVFQKNTKHAVHGSSPSSLAGVERRKRPLVRRTCHFQNLHCTRQARAGDAECGRGRTTIALLRATHHIRLVVPNVGVGEVGVKITAVASRRGGGQMAR